jgi:hypothetical protein
MAINLPIISEWNPKGIDKAIADFKKLETKGEKASFAIKKAAVPATLALAAMGGFLVNAAKGAEEARQANQRLGNVLESMGYGEATERVSAFAESLEKTVAVDADVIKATQTKLATFGKLTASVNEAGGAFDRATLAALDMASAGFGTAESNAVQLGKALEDPIKGITALAKSGVTFTKQEKKKIEALVESGDLLEAQNMILSAVEKQVGGTAAASASSFDKMKFALAGISDTFGELVLPHIDKFSKTLADASKFVQENSKLVGILVLTFGGLAAGIVAVNVAMKIYAATTAAFTAIQAAFNAVMALNPIFLIVAAVVAVIAVLVLLQKEFGLFDGVIRVVGDAFAKVWDAIKFVFDWVKLNWPLLLAVIAGPFGPAILAITTFKDQIIEVFSIIYNGIKATMGFIADVITAPFKAAFRAVAFLWNNTVGKLSFTVPSWVPLIGGKGFDVPDIPMLAEGGIVTSAQLAMIGESGPEAVIPLSKMGGMGFGGGGMNITINMPAGTDGEELVRTLERETRRRGSMVGTFTGNTTRI